MSLIARRNNLVNLAAALAVLLLVTGFFLEPALDKPAQIHFPSFALVYAAGPEAKTPWEVVTDEDEDTHEVDIAAINESRPEVSLVIRRHSHKWNLYVTTGEPIAIEGSPDGHRAIVKYTFDGHDPERDTWNLSADDTALFFPSDPHALIQKIRAAKKFVVEYSTQRGVTKLASFDVSMFPPELKDALDAKASQK